MLNYSPLANLFHFSVLSIGITNTHNETQLFQNLFVRHLLLANVRLSCDSWCCRGRIDSRRRTSRRSRVLIPVQGVGTVGSVMAIFRFINWLSVLYMYISE